MKCLECLVCGKKYDGNDCPVCHFPPIQFPGDREAGIRSMQPTIDSYRERFLAGVHVGIVTYRWKEEKGTLTVDRKETVSIGSGSDLFGKECWLAQRFARIPQVPALEVELSVETEGQETVRKVSLPNRQEAQFQELGAELDTEMNLRLLLRNESGRTESEKLPLFD